VPLPRRPELLARPGVGERRHRLDQLVGVAAHGRGRRTDLVVAPEQLRAHDLVGQQHVCSEHPLEVAAHGHRGIVRHGRWPEPQRVVAPAAPRREAASARAWRVRRLLSDATPAAVGAVAAAALLQQPAAPGRAAAGAVSDQPGAQRTTPAAGGGVAVARVWGSGLVLWPRLARRGLAMCGEGGTAGAPAPVPALDPLLSVAGRTVVE
jgi:hypothetical protein